LFLEDTFGAGELEEEEKTRARVAGSEGAVIEGSRSSTSKARGRRGVSSHESPFGNVVLAKKLTKQKKC